MTPKNDLTCRQAQRLMQRLLDRHWTRPLPPSLRHHLATCQPCHDWQCLFEYEPPGVAVLSADFAPRVVSHYRGEQRRRVWLYRASWFAAAAAVVLTLFLGKVLLTGPAEVREVAQKGRTDLTTLVADVSRSLEVLPGRLRGFSPPPLAWPDISLNVPTPDPLDASLPPLRSLGDTLQGAVGPLERPAREVYQKVIEIIDEPELQKWYRSVKKGMS